MYLLSKSIIRILYNDIMTIEWITLSVVYNTRFLMGILLSLGGISLTSNIAYLISTPLKFDIKKVIVVYLERICIILLLYSFIYYYYVGYIT